MPELHQAGSLGELYGLHEKVAQRPVVPPPEGGDGPVVGLPELSGRVLCETLSPVVASTGVRKGEKLHKRFLSPDGRDFWKVVELNLRRKAAAVGLQLPPGAAVRFEGVGEWRSRLFLAQGTQVRGYEGRFVMEGEESLLYLAHEAGLGERNSQGFGMFRVVRRDER